MAGLETSLMMPEGPTLGRRRLMKGAGAGAVALGTLGGASIATSTAASAATYADSDILNFALNLEYLEAEFYLRATTGHPLSAYTGGSGSLDGVGGAAGPVNGGSLVPFQTTAVANFALRIANDELAHVIFLREALGAAAVAEPAIDFTNAFTTLAVAAGLIVPGQTFDPFASEVAFLLGAYIFEDVGVTAYAGAANLLTVPANLSYAASVLAVEGFHAGAIRGYLSQIGGGAAHQRHLGLARHAWRRARQRHRRSGQPVQLQQCRLQWSGLPAHHAAGPEHRLRRRVTDRRLVLPRRRERPVQEHRGLTGQFVPIPRPGTRGTAP